MTTLTRIVAMAAALALAAVSPRVVQADDPPPPGNGVIVLKGGVGQAQVEVIAGGPGQADVRVIAVPDDAPDKGVVQPMPMLRPAAVRTFTAVGATAAVGAPDEPKDAPPAAERTDVVTTARGDRVTGTVVAIDPGGKLRLKGPQFDAEVVVAAAAVDGVVLKGGEKETGNDEVVLSNGDRLFGTLTAMSADAIVVDTLAAGRLRVSPKVVRSIAIGRSEDVLLDSAFFTGRTDPWVIRGAGMWSVAEGALVCRNRGSAMTPIYAKLDQKEALTMVAKVQSLEGNNLRCDLVLFSDAVDGGADTGRYGRNSLFAMFTTSEAYLQYTSGSSTNHVANRGYGRAAGAGVLRLAYDPATGKARLWLDGTDLGEYVVPSKPVSGQYVMINSIFPLRMEYVRVLRGVVPPSGDEEAPGAGPADESAAVQFANKDRVSATKVALADGQMTLTTTYGEIRCPPQTVSRIVFGRKGIEEPARAKDDVRIRTASCRMTLQFDRLTADQLIGRSECYGGEVRLRRAAVQEIKFNIYK